jgi:hypothetical protein
MWDEYEKLRLMFNVIMIGYGKCNVDWIGMGFFGGNRKMVPFSSELELFLRRGLKPMEFYNFTKLVSSPFVSNSNMSQVWSFAKEFIFF